MSFVTRRLFTRASAVVTGVGATAGAFLYWRSCSWGKAKRIAAVSLSAEEFNAIQNQYLLQDALLPTHLPWTFHALKNSNVDVVAPSTGNKQRSLLRQTRNEKATEFNNDKNNNNKSKGNMPDINTNVDYELIFYRLLGCPYCAKVEALLNFYDVPYSLVGVDPINGRGIPDPRYTLVPQIKFTPLELTPKLTERENKWPSSHSITNINERNDDQRQASHLTENNTTQPELSSHATHVTTNEKPYAIIADSASIISALGKPLGYDNELHNPHIIATREWITNHFQGASFAIVNANMSNAMKTHKFIVPAEYQRLYHRVLGAIALNILVRMKIKPRLLSDLHPFNKKYETVVLAPNKQTFADIARKSPIDWLNVELNIFLSRRPEKCIFHGGEVPDLADIEMYGVTRVVDTHPTLRSVVRNSEFGEWQSAMQQVMLERNKHY